MTHISDLMLMMMIMVTLSGKGGGASWSINNWRNSTDARLILCSQPTSGYLLSLLMRTIIDHKYSNDHAEKLRIVMAHTLLLASGLDLLNTTFLPRCLPSVLHTQAISNMLSAHFVIIMRV